MACPEVFAVASGQAVALDARGNELHLEKASIRRLGSVLLSVRDRHDASVIRVSLTCTNACPTGCSLDASSRPLRRCGGLQPTSAGLGAWR